MPEEAKKDVMAVLDEKKSSTEDAPKTDAKASSKPATGKKKKKKAVQPVKSGHAYIHATYNNTLVTVTDKEGNALAQASAGAAGFRGPKKATPYASSVLVKKLVEKLQGYEMKEVAVFVKGVGSGREGAVRALNANGLNITSIKDITPFPHNGCRKKKPRRV